MKQSALLTFLVPLILLSGAKSQATMPTLINVTNAIQSIYAAQIKQDHGLNLRFILDKEQPQYFGGASINKDDYEITIGREILKLPGMTADAAALVLCHEVGHLLGGAPKKQTNTWASTEGQSDYFAALSCARKVFAKLPPAPANRYTQPLYDELKSVPVDVNLFTSYDDYQLGLRIISAGQQFINAIYLFMDAPQMERPSLTSKIVIDPNEKATTYPTLQCRLKIFLAGATKAPRPPCAN